MTHRNTVQMTKAYKCYLASNAHTLADCYKSYSVDKLNAFNNSKRKMLVVDGLDFRIIGANNFSFSCGFVFFHPQNHRKCFCYITPNYTRFIYLDEIEQRRTQK